MSKASETNLECKSLVQLKQINVINGEASLLEGSWSGHCRADTHDCRADSNSCTAVEDGPGWAGGASECNKIGAVVEHNLVRYQQALNGIACAPSQLTVSLHVHVL